MSILYSTPVHPDACFVVRPVAITAGTAVRLSNQVQEHGRRRGDSASHSSGRLDHGAAGSLAALTGLNTGIHIVELPTAIRTGAADRSAGATDGSM